MIMKYLIIGIAVAIMSQGIVLFDFSPESGTRGWQVVDDVVMGGLSDGALSIDDMGHGVFAGLVSLDNNGGFSSVRYGTDNVDIATCSSFVLRVKGDGRDYQFRVKRSRSDRHSYTFTFKTTGEWQVVSVPFSEMSPTFRGYTPDIPNYPGDRLGEIGFLIGNKTPESFRLLIDKISAE
jgi:hypothetical protein